MVSQPPEELRRKVEGRTYRTIEAKKAKVERVLHRLARDHDKIRSLAG
ncbi:MAG: hypothetical protein HYX83_02610 [Chloroflexi bacterium]|nr:hypothetical protein [Chloroflexota bacterium]